MSGFDKDWLSLREPEDAAARDAGLVTLAGDYLRSVPGTACVMDIGCGTGSTYRSLASRFPEARWHMLDYDDILLAEARRRIADPLVDFRRQDLNDLDSLPLDDVSLVAASAFFDLCSSAFCEAFAERLAERQIALYAALNYDGKITFAPTHPLDEAVIADFNRHQQTDKGFGPALGPQASACLESIFRKRGYKVFTAQSPWRMNSETADLQTAFVDGMVAPVIEIGQLTPEEVQAWRLERLAEIRKGGHAEVGHIDFLALPPG